jgi:hypothetical protein
MWTRLQARQVTPSYVSPPFSVPSSANQPWTGTPIFGQRKTAAILHQ